MTRGIPCLVPCFVQAESKKGREAADAARSMRASQMLSTVLASPQVRVCPWLWG